MTKRSFEDTEVMLAVLRKAASWPDLGAFIIPTAIETANILVEEYDFGGIKTTPSGCRYFHLNDRGRAFVRHHDHRTPAESAVALGYREPEPEEVGEVTAVVVCKRWPNHDNWAVLAEVCPEGIYSDITGDHEPPVVTVLQHRDTREIRVDVYDCEDGLNVSYTNGGVGADEKTKRYQRWFRNISTRMGSLIPVTVRFMCRGDSSNVRISS